MQFAMALLLATLAGTGVGAAESTYICAITERVTESGKVSEDFGEFELVIKEGSAARMTAVLRQAASTSNWQARFILQSDEASTLWFDADVRTPEPHDRGATALYLNLEDGALGLYFEWTLPAAPGQPTLVLAQADLMGRCHLSTTP